MRLIFQRQPGLTRLWLGRTPLALNLPEATLLGLHLPAPARSSCLVVTTEAGEVRFASPDAGWAIITLPGRAVAVHAEGPPLRLSGGLGQGPEWPACRLWTGQGLIPEAHWRVARILGDGCLLALAGSPARPFLRLAAGEMGRITLPWLDLPGPVDPILTVLRGPRPLAELQGLTLTLRAGADCEVLWDDVQLRPNSLANSTAPNRR